MDRDLIIQIASENLKLIRIEQQFTQNKMAEILGISKKCLVQIEKGKALANWTTAIAICALFQQSPTLQSQMGGDPLENVELTIHDVIIRPNEKTFGGVIWWRNVNKHCGFKLQQNLLSKHFRILDDENYRLLSTFDSKVAKEKWQDIVRKL
ncbi:MULTISPECIES: helix-turn-helix transcriptional regulator [Lysinibacillus]|uniref:Helix-turn-helix domain-containing protein n=1 Tax=Lysinibacillus antri TaxID=2498145 RepID=A0A432L8E8_9BACI|nr:MULTISPECIES: helix-turn-helix domain-containing protein [Lysinibacillus]RUL48706.1 helix-turn-helix domain-containing protein [Lysinibacillus antri]TSI08675.1 helix-turn-helix domain-containing protein [Lysinibacillus sp. BW-2-10]